MEYHEHILRLTDPEYLAQRQQAADAARQAPRPDGMPDGQQASDAGVTSDAAAAAASANAPAPAATEDDDRPEKPIVPPDWRPFPVELLPAVCQEFITATAGNIGCDESYVALPLLSALAGAIGNARTIALNACWREPAILWTAIVGESGTRKTPAIESVSRLLSDRERRNFEQHRQALKQYQQHKQLYDQQVAVWVREEPAAHTPPEFDEPVPVCRRELVSDISIGTLAGLLEENPHGLTMVRDELHAWLSNFEKPKSRRGMPAYDWLASFNGSPLVVEQRSKRRPAHFVPHASLSLTGGIQPEVFRQSLQQMGNNGIGARLLIAHPPHRDRKWVKAVDTSELRNSMADLLERLHRLDAPADAGGGNIGVAEGAADAAADRACRVAELDGVGVDLEAADGMRSVAAATRGPRALPLSAEAEAEWVWFFERHARELKELTGDLAAAWTKLEAYAARLALVVHVVRGACGEADPNVIDAESLRAGVQLAEWFGNEVLRFYALFANSEDAAARLRLIALIQRRQGEITVRQLVQSDRRFRGNYVRAEIVLHELVEAGLGAWVFREGTGRRGRWVFRLNDDVFRTSQEVFNSTIAVPFQEDFFGDHALDWLKNKNA